VVELPETIKNAVEALTRLPGVGEKTAFRMVMNMTQWKPAELTSVGQSISSLQHLKHCQDCGMFSEDDLCSVCQDSSRRTAQSLCIVENISDLLAIEKSGTFKGTYHVLGGVLNPLLGVGPEELGIDKIKERIAKQDISEVILAINPSVEGDATCSYFKMILPENILIDRIGFGVPIGGSLEFLDPLTISKALENRKRF